MGMILPWRDVRLDRVPSVQDFEDTATEILEIVGANSRVFKGAAFSGSVARGDLSPRSDLDLTLVGYDGSYTLARSLARDFDALAARRGIPLDCHLWPASLARLGRHGYGPSYLETFPRFPDAYAVGRPLAECFRVRPGCIDKEMRAKMTHKLRSTRTRAWIFETRHADDLEMVEQWLVGSWSRVVRPMRVHVTLGRRLLWWRHASLPYDGKADVINQFLRERTFEPFHERYSTLCDLDQDYDRLLARACAGKERRCRYLKKVKDLLLRNFRVSLGLLSEVSRFMREEPLGQAA